MKTAHSGNIANNAYLIAKFLRRLGEDAHAYHFRHEFIMGHPEWEDADFVGDLEPFNPPDWNTIEFTNGFTRPDWVHYLSGQVDPYVLPPNAPAGPVAKMMEATYGDQSAPSPGGLIGHLRRTMATLGRRYSALMRQGQRTNAEEVEVRLLNLMRVAHLWITAVRVETGLALTPALRAVKAEIQLINADSRIVTTGGSVGIRDLHHAPNWPSYRSLSRDHQLVQFYGLEAIKGVLVPPTIPFVAFEHSTMRTLPFENTVQGRLLNLAYRTADACVITNPDVVSSARRLGLKDYRFIPHPIDETKYAPPPNGTETALRRELRQATGAELLFLCPTRHEWSNAFDSKRSDRVLRAFAAYTQNPDHPRAALILCRWGRDVRASESLIEELGITSHVVWKAPMHKIRLRDHYQACDVVLDQFHEAVGTFGTVTAEGLSCALPVIMYFNPGVHEWCLPEMPPIQSALTEDEIAARLSELALDTPRRHAIGRASREWIIRWHGWERCARDHQRLHTEVLSRYSA
ncbi:MAG: glycosyltransferase family 4 protein [Chloroflexi bacterium]|nr:glycosyltransferase family 4 protein [Chloroflexota bacterium]